MGSISEAIHPKFSEYLPRWSKCRVCWEGEDAVKEAGPVYLPYTSGQIADGAGVALDSIGQKAYNAYRKRAHFHGIFQDAVLQAMGMLHHKPATYELPRQLEPLLERATVNGDPLSLLHMKVNLEQLTTGRIGLLLDLPNALVPQNSEIPDLPYIATYAAETIRNWDDGAREQPTLQNLNLVILDESEYERNTRESVDDYHWEFVNKYRVLVLGDPNDNEGVGAPVAYQSALVRIAGGEKDDVVGQFTTPVYRGEELPFIPFVFVNSMDLLPTPFRPPMEAIANLDLVVYRGEADYRQALFMQGQDTLVISGLMDDTGDDRVRTGAGAVIHVPTNGDAKFIGVSSSGLSEMRSALENDLAEARQRSGQLLEKGAQVESGEALRRRMMAKHVTLSDIARAGAEGLERILKQAAVWVGADPAAVRVIPNMDFVVDEVTGKDVTDWMSAKAMGAPISLETIHDQLRKREFTDLTFEEEIEKIMEERQQAEDAGLAGPPGGGMDDDDDGGGEDDDEEDDDDDDA